MRPILLTAAAVVFGEAVLLLDPVMRGLGLTLMSGAAAGTALTLVLVPAVYYYLTTETRRFEAWTALRRKGEWHRRTTDPPAEV